MFQKTVFHVFSNLMNVKKFNLSAQTNEPFYLSESVTVILVHGSFNKKAIKYFRKAT